MSNGAVEMRAVVNPARRREVVGHYPAATARQADAAVAAATLAFAAFAAWSTLSASRTVFVNVHRIGASDVAMDFGYKQSGIGISHDWVAVEECSELQVIAHRPGWVEATSRAGGHSRR